MAIFFFLLQGIKLSQPPPRARRGIHSTIKPPPAGLESPHVPVPGLGSLHQQPRGVDEMGVRCKKPAHQLPWGWDTRASHPLVPKQRGPGQPGLRNRGNFLRKR